MNPVTLVSNNDDHRSYRAGEKIFNAGEQGNYMYIVIDGEVLIERDGQIVRTIAPGDIFGEMSLIDASPRSADAVAKTDCIIAPVDERHFLFLVHETPMFALHVMGVMANRLRSHLDSK